MSAGWVKFPVIEKIVALFLDSKNSPLLYLSSHRSRGVTLEFGLFQGMFDILIDITCNFSYLPFKPVNRRIQCHKKFQKSFWNCLNPF